MSHGTRRRAAGAIAAGALAAAVALLATPASGQIVGDVELEDVTFEEPESGSTVAALPVVMAGTVTAREPFVIHDVQLFMTVPGGPDGCAYDATVHVRDVEETDPPTTPPLESAPTSTAEPTTPTTEPPLNEYRFRFDVTPPCNGIYEASIRANVSTFEREPQWTAYYEEDGEPPLTDLEISVPPPAVQGVVARLNPDKTVTVSWQAPDGYDATAAAPADFLGYGIQRADRDRGFAPLGFVGPTVTTFVDSSLATAAAGIYRYNVVAVRQGAAPGSLVISEPSAAAQIAIVGPAPRPTVPRTAPPAAGGGGNPVIATTTSDPGFASTLDYGDLEPGEEQAVLPEDAGALLRVDSAPGTGLLVPFAVASVLVVWAMHLRYLSRRAAEPL